MLHPCSSSQSTTSDRQHTPPSRRWGACASCRAKHERCLGRPCRQCVLCGLQCEEQPVARPRGRSYGARDLQRSGMLFEFRLERPPPTPAPDPQEDQMLAMVYMPQSISRWTTEAPPVKNNSPPAEGQRRPEPLRTTTTAKCAWHFKPSSSVSRRRRPSTCTSVPLPAPATFFPAVTSASPQPRDEFSPVLIPVPMRFSYFFHTVPLDGCSPLGFLPTLYNDLLSCGPSFHLTLPWSGVPI
jgi:hypothetical protein